MKTGNYQVKNVIWLLVCLFFLIAALMNNFISEIHIVYIIFGEKMSSRDDTIEIFLILKFENQRKKNSIINFFMLCFVTFFWNISQNHCMESRSGELKGFCWPFVMYVWFCLFVLVFGIMFRTDEQAWTKQLNRLFSHFHLKVKSIIIFFWNKKFFVHTKSFFSNNIKNIYIFISYVLLLLWPFFCAVSLNFYIF
jgi:hypothetical protein